MTPLAGKLAAQIRATGPMTVADYMAACLSDPEHGYYMRRDPFGRAGDFVTAPEVSQMFGELIGLFVVAAWERMGEPASVVHGLLQKKIPSHLTGCDRSVTLLMLLTGNTLRSDRQGRGARRRKGRANDRLFP